MPQEPIFGPAAGSFFVQLVTLAVALCIVFGVLLLGVFAKDEAHRLLYGDPATAHVAPGSYEWTPDKGLRSLNEKTH